MQACLHEMYTFQNIFCVSFCNAGVHASANELVKSVKNLFPYRKIHWLAKTGQKSPKAPTVGSSWWRVFVTNDKIKAFSADSSPSVLSNRKSHERKKGRGYRVSRYHITVYQSLSSTTRNANEADFRQIRPLRKSIRCLDIFFGPRFL